MVKLSITPTDICGAIVCIQRPKVDIDVSSHSVQLPLLVYCLLRLC